MNNIKEYLKLFRVKQYIKNFLIFIPCFFANNILSLQLNEWILLLIGFIAFSFTSSIIYIINDINDVEHDRKNEFKKNRPIASGKISLKNAYISIIVLFIINIVLLFFLKQKEAIIILFLYFILNVLYSKFLKNIPIIDVYCLSAFYLIRIIYGGFLTNTHISIYLYLTVFSCAFYLGINKRHAELINNKSSRIVLERYDRTFLENLSYSFLSLTILFYSIWVINYNNFMNKTCLFISIFIVILILLSYQYISKDSKNGDPVSIVLENYSIILSILIFIFVIFLGVLLGPA